MITREVITHVPRAFKEIPPQKSRAAVNEDNTEHMLFVCSLTKAIV